jgi:FkbM family methyltransferase
MKFFTRILNSIAYRLGYEKMIPKALQENTKTNLISNFFECVKQSGIDVKLVIDIGANRGGWTTDVMTVFANADFHLFEPQGELLAESELNRNPKITINNVAVSDRIGKSLFTLNPHRDDSSTLRLSEGEAMERGWQQVEIEITTIDEYLNSRNLPIPQIIKIDAEGHDLEVLKGASRVFGKTEVILVEAAIVNKTLNNSILKVINEMDERGYRLFEITDLNRPFKHKVLWLVELAFVLKEGKIDTYYSSLENLNT